MQPDTAPTLKPCPLCGTSDGVTIGPSRAGGLHWHNIECHGCCLYITGNTEAEAIAAWNTRAATPCTECERLAEALQPFADQAETYDSCEQHPNGCPDDALCGDVVDLTVGHFRAARSALASHTVRLIDGGAGK